MPAPITSRTPAPRGRSSASLRWSVAFGRGVGRYEGDAMLMLRQRLRGWGFTLAAALVTASCGGGSAAPGTKTAGAVQGSNMDQTFAGQNRCNPKNHERPF